MHDIYAALLLIGAVLHVPCYTLTSARYPYLPSPQRHQSAYISPIAAVVHSLNGPDAFIFVGSFVAQTVAESFKGFFTGSADGMRQRTHDKLQNFGFLGGLISFR